LLLLHANAHATFDHAESALIRAPSQVCKREDSETYAKRTITEIETCLGFRFNREGGAPPGEEEVIDDADIQVHTWGTLGEGKGRRRLHSFCWPALNPSTPQ